MIDSIKKIAGSVGNATPPCTFMFGTVVNTSPLSVQVDSRFLVGESALVVPRHLRGGEYNCHKHKISCRYTGADIYTEETGENYYGLKTGDKLALLREHGGQRFFVLGVV